MAVPWLLIQIGEAAAAIFDPAADERTAFVDVVSRLAAIDVSSRSASVDVSSRVATVDVLSRGVNV